MSRRACDTATIFWYKGDVSTMTQGSIAPHGALTPEEYNALCVLALLGAALAPRADDARYGFVLKTRFRPDDVPRYAAHRATVEHLLAPFIAHGEAHDGVD